MRFALFFSSIVLALACGDDAGPVDSGNDAAVVDSGPRPDTNPTPDSGPRPDAGPRDAGRDAGPRDAGPDTSADAGPGFLDTYPLMAVHPEGGTYDAENHRFFMGSLVGGELRSVDAETGEDTLFYTPTDEGSWWTLGMDVDETRNRLWVCAMDDLRETGGEPPYDGYVWVFDTESGERVANIDLSVVDVEASCTDVAVHSDGSAYVTDRDKGNIYRVTEDGEPELFVNDFLLEGLLGQNAAVIDEARQLLLVIVYLPSRLIRVPLTGTGRVREVNLNGAFNDASPALSGADGMVMTPDGNLLVAFTSQVTRVVPATSDWMNADATTVEVVPTAGNTDVIAAGAEVFLLNGQAVRFAVEAEPDPFTLTRFDVALFDADE
ncbi:MAG: SMP-30/gluconolactonase/LRE family protein [Polyangiales bacterium]